MDNQRILLFFALSFVLLMIWQAWTSESTTTEQPPVAIENGVQPPADMPSVTSGPAAPSPEMAEAPDAAAPETPRIPETLPRGDRIKVVTDLMEVELDTTGGDIRELLLLAHPISARERDRPFRLMEDRAHRIFIAQSGLLSDRAAPDHYAHYSAERSEYRLEDGADRLVVPLRWESPEGIVVTKRYTFTRDSYVIDVEHRVENRSDAAWTGYQYRQLQRTRPGSEEGSFFLYTYTGAVINTPDKKYEKFDFDDMDSADLNVQVNGGWLAVLQHYFLGAMLPDPNDTNTFYTKAPKDRPYVIGMLSGSKEIAAGAVDSFNARFYIGPKEQDRLKEVAEGLRLTVDYGILTFLAQPLFWLLGHIFDLVGNWGVAIMILTLLIKIVFYKLSEASYRSMANMRRLTPQITQIRERYGDDRQRMSQAMMEIYKKEKINPLGGCLPILVQIPVFIALYWVLLESVEMRQAPFMLWIQDLSVRDPFYVLPVLMGISMFVQMQLNPPPPDPLQAKLLKVLPFVFTLFFAFFPAGLVLYWVTNSVLSIGQQWFIMRRIDKAAEAAKAAKSDKAAAKD